MYMDIGITHLLGLWEGYWRNGTMCLQESKTTLVVRLERFSGGQGSYTLVLFYHL